MAPIIRTQDYFLYRYQIEKEDITDIYHL